MEKKLLVIGIVMGSIIGFLLILSHSCYQENQYLENRLNFTNQICNYTISQLQMLVVDLKERNKNLSEELKSLKKDYNSVIEKRNNYNRKI